MQDGFQPGWSLFVATVLCAGLPACAAQSGDSLRLSEELGRARADAAWQQARAAELESRMLRLEQRAGPALSAERAEERELMNHLVRLIETNERLLAERAAPPIPAAVSAANGTKGSVAAGAPSASRTSASGATVQSEEQELRTLVERLRGHPGSAHGGLTREQEGALRVLTRPERKLDAENPWPAAFY